MAVYEAISKVELRNARKRTLISDRIKNTNLAQMEENGSKKALTCDLKEKKTGKNSKKIDL